MIMHARVCATAGTRHLFVAGLSRKDGMPRVQHAESYFSWVQCGTSMCSCGDIMGLNSGIAARDLALVVIYCQPIYEKTGVASAIESCMAALFHSS